MDSHKGVKDSVFVPLLKVGRGVCAGVWGEPMAIQLLIQHGADMVEERQIHQCFQLSQFPERLVHIYSKANRTG